MVLPTLALFADVPVTRDYSVVRDCSNASQWLRELYNYAGPGESTVSNPATLVKQERVNYYRLPDKIRVEGSYDELRKVTYGVLHQFEWDDDNEAWVPVSTDDYYLERPLFFWVDSVRLVKAGSRGQLYPLDDLSVVELTVTPDVWANNLGQWTLHDSFVVRRHMDRWTESSGVYSPTYIPNAAGDVEGAYGTVSTKEMIGYTSLPDENGNPDAADRKLRAIVVTALDRDGDMQYFIGMDAVDRSGNIEPVHFGSTVTFMSFQSLSDGLFYAISGLSADFVQGIYVLPADCISDMTDYIYYHLANQQTWIQAWMPVSGLTRTLLSSSDGDLYVYKPTNDDVTAISQIIKAYTVASANPVTPDTSQVVSTTRQTSQEPMMYREPARKRMITNGIGGTIVEIPDIEAFDTDVTVHPIVNMSGAKIAVYTGSDIVQANSVGSIGVSDAPNLPIYNSAWRSYEAINKVGDTIQYNASNASALMGGVGNVMMSAVGGFLMGGPAGAAIGAGAGVGNVAGSAYQNKENLRAKRKTIKNSPCTVVDEGPGMGIIISNLYDYIYNCVTIDDNSFTKLEEDYYWRGYFTERFFSGTISLDTREYFDFILTEGARVRGSVNAEDAAAIGSILDRGTTIVHERSFLFDPDATLNNRENSLI